MKKPPNHRLYPIAIVIATQPFPVFAKSVDFVAEHLIEVPMDFRYLAFPKVNGDEKSGSPTVQTGYASIAGGSMKVDLTMLGLSWTRTLTEFSLLTLGVFYDRLAFTRNQPFDRLKPTFGRPDILPEITDIDVSSVKGSGYHAGLSLAWVKQTQNNAFLHFGIALERLLIRQFKVSFSTNGLDTDIDGAVDYAGTYDMITPYVQYQWPARHWSRKWVSGAHVIASLPLPRVGFKGRLTGPDFDIDSDTNAVGNGVHIPDAYLGLGYSFTHIPTRISIDLGASLYSYILEPVGHEDIESPLLITVSRNFQ